MITQILALITATTMVSFLSRLRYFILARDQSKRKFYRTYVAGFDEAGWGSGPDDDSNNESDSQGTTSAPAAVANNLVEWPTELDLQEQFAAHVPKPATAEHAEITEAAKTLSGRRD